MFESSILIKKNYKSEEYINLLSQEDELLDIVLYNSNNIVLFYGENTWSYTRLGKINMDDNEIIDLLSKKDVTITIHK